MVSNTFESKYDPLVLWKRLSRMIRERGDVTLTLQIAYFIWRVPDWLDRMPLPELLQDLYSAPRAASAHHETSLERVMRLSRPWFKLPIFRNRNTCYLRALMFYRFVDPQSKSMQIHFVVEPSRTPGGRLRGHAWVTIGEELIEPPLPEVLVRSRSIYTYPPRAMQ